VGEGPRVVATSASRVSHDDPAVRLLHAQYRLGPLSYPLLLGLAFWHPSLAIVLCLVLALLFLFPPPGVK